MEPVRYRHRLLARIFSLFPGLAASWGRGLEKNSDTIPWANPGMELRDANVALITTGGVHRIDQPPFSMVDPDGDPTWREIPLDTPRSCLTITHDYYDHRDAELDLNLVLPVERLLKLVQLGILKNCHSPAYGLMGHIAGRHLETLQTRTGAEIASGLASAGVDYALLIPA